MIVWQMKTVLIFTFGTGLLALASVACADEGSDLQRLAALVDYLAADYPGAVADDGHILSATEYSEQRGLARDAADLTRRLTPPASASLLAETDTIATAVERRAAPKEVAAACRAVRARLVDERGLAMVPAAPPDRERARSLFATGCAHCHGENGAADTDEARRLVPAPVSFLDGERMSRIAPALAFHALTFGTKETAMPSFDTLPASDRWSLAFHVIALRHSARDVKPVDDRAGEALLTRAGFVATTTRLAELSDGELDAGLRTLAPEERAAAIDWLRTSRTFSTGDGTGRGRTFDVARRGLASLAGVTDARLAHDRVLGAYLDGVEPHEASLKARDPILATRIEDAFLDLRKLVDERAGDSAIAERVAQLDLLLDRAEERDTSDAVLFGASLTIALREGLETALLVAALLAFLRKSGRGSSAHLVAVVHWGWIAALPAGALTWLVAGKLITGAHRELVEAVVTLMAAALIVGVTHWVLGGIAAQRWVGFLRRKVTATATDGHGAWPLFGLAFFAAYREACEVVLFYQALLLDAGGRRSAVALGAVAGVVGIAVVLLVLARLGRHLNPRPVMLASSALLSLLAIALVGRGVRALQEGAYLPLHPLHLPDLSTIGLYPSAEGLLAQLVVVLLLLTPTIMSKLRPPAPIEPQHSEV